MTASIESIRKVEKNVRNLAAHEIVSITDGRVKEMCGLDTQEIMEKLKQITEKSGMQIKKEYWNSYDEMNQMIKENL